MERGSFIVLVYFFLDFWEIKHNYYNDWGQCNIPALEGAATYTHVAAGTHHTVLRRGDGTVVACGGNIDGRCNIPAQNGDVMLQKSADTTVRRWCRKRKRDD